MFSLLSVKTLAVFRGKESDFSCLYFIDSYFFVTAMADQVPVREVRGGDGLAEPEGIVDLRL